MARDGESRRDRRGGAGPQRVRDLLGRASSGLGLKDPVATGVLWSRWRQIVGADIAAHADPTSLKDGVLRIRADSPVWATEIGYLGDEIRRRANEAVGPDLVSEVRVWHGPRPQGHEAPQTSKQPQSDGCAGPRLSSGPAEPGPRLSSGPAEPGPRVVKREGKEDPQSALERARAAWRKSSDGNAG